MSVTSMIKNAVKHVLEARGSAIVPLDVLYEWQRERNNKPGWHDSALPENAAEYLRPDNPKLVELKQRYRAFDSEVTTPFVWNDDHVRAEDIAHFRGDNAWLYQLRGRNANALAYALSFYYLKSIDRLQLLDSAVEDDSFGNFAFTIAGRAVSRDLLDSMAEIYFLDRHLGVGSRTGLRVLDVGAGYGRLAHRMVTALPAIGQFFCTDAVAVSTFVSDYYLRFRGAAKAVVVPLDDIDRTLRENPIDLAINVHSFSECRPQAIEWWTRLLAKHRVKNVMVVPNADAASLGERLLTNDGYDFLPLFERYGYRTVHKEPKFLDPMVQKYGLHPTWHHLLELHGRQSGE